MPPRMPSTPHHDLLGGAADASTLAMAPLESALAAPALAVFAPVISLGLSLVGLAVLWCLVGVTRWVVTTLGASQPQPAPLHLVGQRRPAHRRRSYQDHQELDRAA
jgi:hypothetical protein